MKSIPRFLPYIMRINFIIFAYLDNRSLLIACVVYALFVEICILEKKIKYQDDLIDGMIDTLKEQIILYESELRKRGKQPGNFLGKIMSKN